MAKSKKVNDKVPSQAEAVVQETVNNKQGAVAWLNTRWPANFASLKTTFLLCVLWLALGIAIYLLAMNGGLITVKRVLAYLLGVGDLGLRTTSTDIAAVLLCLSAVVLGTLIHPSVGLAIIIVLRPWLDAFTFPTDNIYFLWGVLFIFVLWGVKVLMRRERVYFLLPTTLLGAFVVWAWLLSGNAMNYATAYRALLLWSTYFFLFVLAANLCRDSVSRKIILGASVTVLGLQAGFALLQYFYILPYLRTLLNASPEVLQQFLGIQEMNPELARRFNVNRAFGTVLFPNALAAFLILIVPLSMGMLKQCWTQFSKAWATRVTLGKTIPRKARTQLAIAGGIGIWFVSTILLFTVISLPSAYDTARLSSITSGTVGDNTLMLAGLSALLALLPAGLVLVLSKNYGIQYALRALVVLVLMVVPVLGFIALYLTFSRGGMLAFAVALVGGALVYFAGERLLPAAMRKRIVGTALVLFMVGSLFVMPRVNAQPEAQPEPVAEGTVVTTEGVQADFGNVGSFSLRWSYWRVSLDILKDNALTGVGLGNFQWAYPQYQYVGAGDVKEAHNGYLQAACETGIIGGLILILFWAVVLLTGVGAVLQQKASENKFIVIALFTGVLAFAIHSVIDINFSHPGLMFLIMLLAGALISFRNTPEPETRSGAFTYALMALLVVAALVMGASTRVFLQEQALSRMKFLNITRTQVLQERLVLGQYFLQVVRNHAKAQKQPPPMSVLQCMLLFKDTQELADIGTLYEPTTNGHRRLENGETPSEQAIVVFDKPWEANFAARPHLVNWVRELEYLDSLFPYEPELAHHIGEWYGMISDALGENDKVEKDEFGLLNLIWAKEAIERNAQQADLYIALGNAYWRQGALADNKNRVGHFNDSLAALEKAPLYAPCMPVYLDYLAGGYKRFGASYGAGGYMERQEKYFAKAQEVEKKSAALKQQRMELGL